MSNQQKILSEECCTSCVVWSHNFKVIKCQVKSSVDKTFNRPFPSALGPLQQNELKCSAFDIEIIFHPTYFHKKGCALGLILKVRVFGTQKRPISAIYLFIYSYISVVRVLQFPPEGWLRMSIGHCGITWVTIRPNGRVSLKCMGDTGHIAPENLSSWTEKYMFTKRWRMSCMLYAGNLYFMDTIHYLIYAINLSFNAKLIHVQN